MKIPHHWCMPGPETFGPRTDEGFDEVARQLKDYLAGGRRALLELEQLTLGAGGARSAGHRRRVAGGSSARRY